MRRALCSIALIGSLVLVWGAWSGCDESKGSRTATPGKDTAGAPAAGKWTAACEAYARQCPAWKDLDKCTATCGKLDHPEEHEMCAFVFCGAEVGKCDDDEEGDTAVEKCLDDKGWL